jgi:hypothetical protein
MRTTSGLAPPSKSASARKISNSPEMNAFAGPEVEESTLAFSPTNSLIIKLKTYTQTSDAEDHASSKSQLKYQNPIN